MGWFVIINEDVTGPLSTEEVMNLKQNSDINLSATSIWGPQISYWLKYNEWVQSHKSILNNSEKRAQAKVQTWYYAEDNKAKPKGPFERSTLIEHVASIEVKDNILVWTKGMQAWASVFEFRDILNELNISRRKHPRAPITGKVSLKDKTGQSYIGKINAISQGGCGISHVSGLVPGEIYQIEIRCDALYNPVSAMGLILREIGKDKFGVRFEKIHVESKSTIISYLKDQGLIQQNKEKQAA